jgi:quinol-cytochrome oxidoreductase complex cytochrome b subunit
LNGDIESCLFVLGIAYFIALSGWGFMNLIPEGEKSPLVSQVVADIWVAFFAVITCSSWAYFS